MNKLIKVNQKNKRLKQRMLSYLSFVFSNAIATCGIASLIAFMITDLLLYLQVASIFSFAVMGLIFIMSSQALYLFGLEKCFVEIEAKFLELTLYSALISGTLVLLIIELFKMGQ